MIVDGFDYERTVETQKLVFKGQKAEKITSYVFQFIAIVCGLMVSYFVVKFQLENKPSLKDYFVAVFFPLLIVIVVGFFCKTLSTRDKLKEIEININKDKARLKLLEAANALNWRADVISDRYIVFVTKSSFANDCQTVTLIFFPDRRIFFNSVNYPNDYRKQSRFRENYEALMTEYLRIEKD